MNVHSFAILHFRYYSFTNYLSISAMDNFTALHFASSPGVVKLLVAKDRSLLGARVSKGNKTALHLAASKGLVPVVEALLNCGADINAKTAQGQTAIEISKSEAVRRLLQDWKPPAPSAEPADDSSLLSGIDRAAENKRRRQDEDVDDDMDESATRSAPASLHSTSTSTIATAAGVTVSSRDIEESGLPAVSAEEEAGTGTGTGTRTSTDTVSAVDPAVADAAAVAETSSLAKRARKAPLLSHLLHDD